jgi:hypothetical protein
MRSLVLECSHESRPPNRDGRATEWPPKINTAKIPTKKIAMLFEHLRNDLTNRWDTMHLNSVCIWWWQCELPERGKRQHLRSGSWRQDRVGDDVAAGRWIVFVPICDVQSESLGRRLVFHHLLLYGRYNATDIFRKFIRPVLLNRQKIVTHMNSVRNDRKVETSQSIIINRALDVKQRNIQTYFYASYLSCTEI